MRLLSCSILSVILVEFKSNPLQWKVDPENYLGYSPHSPLDPGGDINLGQSLAQTQSMVRLTTDQSEHSQ